MPDTLCQRCWEPLPEGAAACVRCGTPRPAAPRVPVVAPAMARRFAVGAGVTVLALAAAVTLPSLWRDAPGEPAGGASREVAQAGPPAGVRSIPVSELPETMSCLIDDQPLPAPECARWVLRADGDSFTHVASDGDAVVAALFDGVIRLDAATGEVLWHWRNPQARSPRVPAAALAVAGDRVLVVLEADHRIVALDLDRGALLWEAPIVEKRQAWLVAAAEAEAGPAVVAVREPASLSVRSLEDGRMRWRVPLRAGGTAPVIADGKVVTQDGDALTALDLATGAHAWTAAGTYEPGAILARLGERTVVAAAPDGQVMGLDTPTGTRLWDGDAPDGQVMGLDTPTGTRLWDGDAPGTKQLVSLGGEHLAVMTGSGLHVFGTQGRVDELTLATQFVSHAVPAGTGAVLASIGTSLQRLDPELDGETWTLHGDPSIRSSGAVFIGEPAGPSVLAMLGGSLLAAFDAPPPRAPDAQGCEGARPTEAMGALDGWRGERALVTVMPFGEGMRHVLVGLPGAPGSRRFSVSAHRAGDPDDAARFARHPDDVEWRRSLDIQDGARTSAGWPTHWSLMARMEPGCWVFRISGDRVPVVIPEPPPSPPPSTQE